MSARSSLVPRYILLTLDAFGTLIRPRVPIAQQYLSAATDAGLKVDHISRQDLFASFKAAFKETSQSYPKYGRRIADMTAYKWWGTVVQKTFKPLITISETPSDKKSSSLTKDLEHEQVTERLQGAADLLWHRFSGTAYELCPDARPMFEQISNLRRRLAHSQDFINIVVGVVTNADPRIPTILSHLGLRLRPGEALSPNATRMNALEATSRLESTEPKDFDIDFVLTSYDAGAEKPDPAIFRQAALLGEKACLLRSQLRSPKAQGEIAEHSQSLVRLIHVGDDPKTDVQGAMAAEWDVVLLQRSGEAGADYNWRLEKKDHYNVRVITSLEELSGMLEELITT